MRPLCLCASAFFLLPLMGCADWTPPAVAQDARGLTPPARTAQNWQGVAACSYCHGPNGPKGTNQGNEYTTWIERDKHARAYEVLFNDRSKRIAKNLGIAAPEKSCLCLNCHSYPNAEQLPADSRASLGDGVSCETCHGGAEKWLDRHYLRDWATMNPSDKAAFGMIPTQELVARVEACVACHVGSPGREVNHDLLAAGHPRLNFEFGTYLANMPKHWKEKDDRPDFQARVWAVGQVVAAEAALKLLEHRAGDPKQPWPEFAEYDCFACHHDLREPSWRQANQPHGDRKPGSLSWGAWYFSVLPKAVEGVPNVSLPLEDLEKLKSLMSQSNADRKQVADRARSVAAQLKQPQEQLAKANYDSASVRRLLESLAKDDPKLVGAGWDGAAQRYLGIAALYHAIDPKDRTAERKAALDALFDQLKFPAKFESPRDFDPTPFDKRFKELQKRLEK